MQFFGHRTAAPEPVEVVRAAPPAELEAAYDRGRRDEREHRRARRHPILGLAVAAVAIAGAGIIGLAAAEGSFAAGGQVLDAQLAVASGQARVASRDAATATTEAARDAGANLRQRIG